MSKENVNAVVASLSDRFSGVTSSEFRNQTRVVISTGVFYEAMQFLRDEHSFDMLVDVTCVDYLAYRDATDRFGMVYLLSNTNSSERLTVRVFLNEPELIIPSIVSLWPGADWLEREVWDMFGITFDGHPDHRRILMPDEFTAHPLRKDYPLQGRGERHNFETITRAENA